MVVDQNATLNMTGGTFDLSMDFDAYSDGNDVVGVLIWGGSSHKQENCAVNISGGTFKVGGKNAFAQAVQVGMSNGYSENCTVNISGGNVVLNPTEGGKGYVYTAYKASYATAAITSGTVSGKVTAIANAYIRDLENDGLTISGGTFSGITVDEKYLADGKTLDASGNVVDKAPEVKPVTVNGVGYDTLAAAIAAAESGATVKLLADVNENVEIAAGKNLTLDLNGFTLNGGTGTNKAALTNYGTITITDSSEAKTGTIKRDDIGTVGETSYYVILNQGTMTIESGNVINNSGYKKANSTGSMVGSSLICNGDCNGGSTLTINGGTFTQYNFIAIKNGALGVLNVTGGMITSNHSAIQNWFEADITGGEINGQLWTDAYTAGGSNGKTKIGGNATFTGEIVMDIYGNSVAPKLEITGGKLNVTNWRITGAAAAVGAKPAVSGGTFTAKVPAEYLADGFEIKESTDASGNTTYGVEKAASYVAKIGEQSYATLQAAFDAAKTGDTITLVADTKLDSVLNIDKNVTIELGGHTVTAAAVTTTRLSNDGCYAGIIVKGAADVKFRNGTLTSAYTTYKDGTTDARYSSYVLLVDDTAELTLDKVTVTGQNAGDSYVRASGGICYDSTGSLSVLNSTVTAGASTGKGYNYNNPDAIFTVSGSAGSVAIDNSTVTGGAAAGLEMDKDASEAINANGSVNVTISNGSKLTGGASERTAGNAVEYRGSGKLTVTASTLTGGSSTGGIGGSALYEQSPTGNAVIEVADSTITGGNGGASWDGSGISCNKNATITVRNSTVKSGNGEKATGNAAAITLPNYNNANLTLEDTTLSGAGKNTVVKNGLYSDTTVNGTLTIAEGKLEKLAISAAGDDATIKVSKGASVDAATVISTGEKALEAQDDGSYSFTSAAAQVIDSLGNKMSYATLAAAYAAAEDGETVTLLADTTEDVTIDKNITLDLGGKTLTNAGAGKATLTIAKGATATVKNGSVVGGTSYYTIQNNGTATLEDVTATAGNTGSSMIDNYGTLTIKSGTYEGGLNVVKSEEGSTLTINGGKFTLEYATEGYTGVVFAYGNTTITGGEFIQNLTTTGRWNHPTVILTGVVEGYTAITRVTGGHFVNKMSGESIFRGAGKGTSDNFEVSGGTFNKSVPDSFFKEGYFAQKNTDGTYGVGGPAVAKVNSAEGYNTLAEAIAAAKAGETVTLLQNVTVDKPIIVGKAITLDLGGKTLTSTWAMPSDASGADRYALVNNAKMTLTNGTFAAGEARAIGAYAGLTLNNVTVSQTLTGGHACVAFCKDGATYTIKDSTINGAYAVANFANNATIKITGSELNGSGCGLYHNGSNYGLELTVRATTINGSLDGAIGNENDPSGVYISGSTATVEKGGMQFASFTNCTIKGATAIEVKYTNLKLDKCTVEATAKTPSYSKNNNGMTALGFAVVSTDNSKDGVTPVPAGTVTITGKGNYTGLVGLGALKSVKETYKDFADGTIKVSGGTFDSAVMPEYCADGFVPTQNDNGTYGVREANYVAQIGSTKYESLAEAIDKAGTGDTVTLLANLDLSATGLIIAKNKDVTLDLNGKTLKLANTDSGNIMVEGKLTLKDSTDTEKNGTGTGKVWTETPYIYGSQDKVLIAAIDGGTFTMESGLIDAASFTTDNTNKGQFAVSVQNENADASVIINGGCIKAGWYAIAGNGQDTTYNGNITVNGGILESTADYAIYHPHSGTTTINGGVVFGAAGGISLNRGKLIVNGGTITSKGTGTTGDWGDGTGSQDAAAINVNAGYGSTSVEIKGGKITAEKNAILLTNGKDGTISVSGGTFSSAVKEEYCATGYIPTANADGTYGVKEGKYVAYVGTLTSKFETLQAAIDAAKDGQIVRLLADITLTETAVFPAGKKVSINLQGHNITATGTALRINGKTDIQSTGGNGTIKSTGNVAVAVGENANLTVYSGTLEGREGAVITGTSTGATIDIRKNATLIATDNAVIAGNGSKRDGNPNTILVKGGTFIGGIESTGYIACGIYAPWNDNVTVSGGTFNITNGAGIVARAGTVKVTGGTFNCTGNGTGWVGDNKNQIPCAALVFDKAANYPALTDASQILVSGGSFSTDPAANGATLAAGYVAAPNESGMYKVEKANPVAEINGVKYDTLSQAIAALEDKGGTIKLLQDINAPSMNYKITENITIDLNGHNITGSGAEGVFYVYTSGHLTITGDGVITAVENNKAAIAVQVFSEKAKVTLEGGTYKQKITNTNDPHFDLIYVYYGTAEIKGGTYEGATPDWTLNCIDDSYKAGTAHITVTGGTFVGFDPANNKAEGEGTSFVPTGYVSTKGADGNFVVTEVKVAEVNGVAYATLSEAIVAANAGDTVKLIADVEQNTCLVINKSITLNLDGHKISNTEDIWDVAGYYALVAIEDNADVTITGDGTIAAKENDCYTIDVKSGKLTIESGKYIGNVSAIQVQKASLVINGGTFSLLQKWNDKSTYLINCIDDDYKNGNATVAISGGTFVDFDPNVSPEQPVDGKVPSFVAEGVGVNADANGNFTAKANMVAQRTAADGSSVAAYATLPEALAAAKSGETVTLLTNIDSSVSAMYSAQNLTIDLNGYTIKGGTLSTAALKLSVKAVRDANYAVTITSGKDGGAIVGQLPLQLGGSYLANEIKIAIDDSVKLTVLEGGTNAVNQKGNCVYLVGTDTTKTFYKNGGFMVTVNGEDRIYETLGNARAAADYVTLLNDFTTKDVLTIREGWAAFTLDLDGHTYECTRTKGNMITLEQGANVTFKNGILKNVSAEYDLETSPASVISVPYSNATLTVEDVTLETTGDYGIATNGSNTGINITLNDSSIKAPNGVGVYFPSTGSLTINGGSILANTGVQVSAGSMTITGGSITATGTSTEDVSSGSILDGAAVSIIARGGYGALGTLSISGGTFISASGVAAVQAYSIDNDVKGDWTRDGFITGGSFNNIPEDMAKLCAEGYTYTMPTDDDPMYYVVKADEEQIDVKRSLTLGNSLIMNYKVLLPKGYTNPHIVFESYDAKAGAFYSVPVADYTLQTKGEETRYVFAFTETNPQRMTDTLKATVYATKGETEKAFPIDDYSVASYCNALLASDANKNGAYDELVGNLVAYGTAAQLYQNYHTDKLVKDVVNGGTAVTYPISEAVEVNKLNKVTGGVVIETKSLVLNNAFAIRVKFTLEDNTTIDQVKFTVAVDGKTTTIGSESFHEGTLSNGTSCYYFDFADLNSRQLDSTVTFTAVVDGTNNDVLEFSANTYLKLMAAREGVSTKLMNLLTTLYSYGCTCGKFK